MTFIRYWLPVIFWMTVIFLLSGRHSVSVSSAYFWNFLFFKTLHLIEYAFLYVLTYRAVKNTSKKKYWSVLAFIITISYAVTDEIHQTFVPSREGRARDVIIDGLGAILAWITINQLLPKAPKRLRQWARDWQFL